MDQRNSSVTAGHRKYPLEVKLATLCVYTQCSAIGVEAWGGAEG